MKKEKFLENMIGAIVLILYSAILLSSSLTFPLPVKVIVPMLFFLYGLIHFVIFFLNKKEKQYFSLALGSISFFFLFVSFVPVILEVPKNFALFLLAWTFCVSFVKLKKADFYHDRKSKFWHIEISSLFLFLLSSILVSVNLFHKEEVLVLIFGFYAFILGSLEFFEALFLNLTKGKLK